MHICDYFMNVFNIEVGQLFELVQKMMYQCLELFVVKYYVGARYMADQYIVMA